MLRFVIAGAIAAAPVAISAQDNALSDRVMQAVRVAIAPALPFPASDPAGSLPADGKSDAPWMVRPIEPGERTIQILANPLNEEHQRRAAKAMAEIEASIEAAQRRAEAQFERAVAEAKRTGRSQEVDGVTLSDEGIAGAKIDAESHVTIDVLFNQPSYRFEVAGSMRPGPELVRPLKVSAIAELINVPSHTYRDRKANIERYCESETQVYLGRVATPEVQRREESLAWEITAATVPTASSSTVSSLVLRFRGNPALITELLTKSDWASLVELLK